MITSPLLELAAPGSEGLPRLLVLFVSSTASRFRLPEGDEQLPDGLELVSPSESSITIGADVEGVAAAAMRGEWADGRARRVCTKCG